MRARWRMPAAAAGVVVTVCVLAIPRPVEAAWTDREYATTTLGSTGLATPTKNSCVVNGGLTATYHWTNVSTGAPRTGYIFEIYSGAVLVGSAAPAANATSQSTSGLLTLAVGTYAIHLRAANNLWRSTVLAGTMTVSVAGLITACAWN